MLAVKNISMRKRRWWEARSYQSRKADKLDDNESGYCEEDSASFAETVVEQLGDWLVNWTGKNFRWVTHTEAEHNVEQETGNICEQHGHRNSPRGFDLGFRNLFGDMCRRIIISHGP